MRGKIIILLSIMMLITTSCRHKELCYDHSHMRYINVAFDWTMAPDASPGSMSVYFFPEEGGKPIRYEFTDRSGGRIRIKSGNYRAICLNSDTQEIEIHNGADFSAFCISTKDELSINGLNLSGSVSVKSLPKAKSAIDQRWVRSPEHIWTDCLDEICIDTQDQTITLTPEPQIRNCTVEIRNAKNLKWINGISASVSSMSGGYYPTLRMVSDELVTIPFETRYNVDEELVTGGFTTFGHCPDKETTHNLVIYAILADESKWYYTYDVTDQIHNAEDQYNIHIVLDELPLPKPVVNGGGFKPSVGEWKEIDIYISM